MENRYPTSIEELQTIVAPTQFEFFVSPATGLESRGLKNTSGPRVQRALFGDPSINSRSATQLRADRFRNDIISLVDPDLRRFRLPATYTRSINGLGKWGDLKLLYPEDDITYDVLIQQILTAISQVNASKHQIPFSSDYEAIANAIGMRLLADNRAYDYLGDNRRESHPSIFYESDQSVRLLGSTENSSLDPGQLARILRTNLTVSGDTEGWTNKFPSGIITDQTPYLCRTTGIKIPKPLLTVLDATSGRVPAATIQQLADIANAAHHFIAVAWGKGDGTLAGAKTICDKQNFVPLSPWGQRRDAPNKRSRAWFHYSIGGSIMFSLGQYKGPSYDRDNLDIADDDSMAYDDAEPDATEDQFLNAQEWTAALKEMSFRDLGNLRRINVENWREDPKLEERLKNQGEALPIKNKWSGKTPDLQSDMIQILREEGLLPALVKDGGVLGIRLRRVLTGAIETLEASRSKY